MRLAEDNHMIRRSLGRIEPISRGDAGQRSTNKEISAAIGTDRGQSGGAGQPARALPLSATCAGRAHVRDLSRQTFTECAPHARGVTYPRRCNQAAGLVASRRKIFSRAVLEAIVGSVTWSLLPRPRAAPRQSFRAAGPRAKGTQGHPRAGANEAGKVPLDAAGSKAGSEGPAIVPIGIVDMRSATLPVALRLRPPHHISYDGSA